MFPLASSILVIFAIKSHPMSARFATLLSFILLSLHCYHLYCYYSVIIIFIIRTKRRTNYYYFIILNIKRTREIGRFAPPGSNYLFIRLAGQTVTVFTADSSERGIGLHVIHQQRDGIYVLRRVCKNTFFFHTISQNDLL